jgi:beta-glucanase (GH16 family)
MQFFHQATAVIFGLILGSKASAAFAPKTVSTYVIVPTIASNSGTSNRLSWSSWIARKPAFILYSSDDDYVEIFRDDFDGPLNHKIWGFDIGRGPNNDGWGNQEKQTYTDSEKNAFTKNGVLNVRICKESSPDYYTSARLVTRATFSFAYGKIETRIRIQKHLNGPFSAVWALSLMVDNPTVGWPMCGEIDVFEYQSLWDFTPATLHFEARHGGDALSFHGNQNFLTNDWHDYKMEWTPSFIAFSHDGKEIGRYNRPNEPTNETWPYREDNPFYLIINNALYPSWGTAPDANFTEHTLEVDYISVSRRQNYDSST